MRVYVGIVFIDGSEQLSTAIFQKPDDDHIVQNMPPMM
jgi:hypothetical protein